MGTTENTSDRVAIDAISPRVILRSLFLPLKGDMTESEYAEMLYDKLTDGHSISYLTEKREDDYAAVSPLIFEYVGYDGPIAKNHSGAHNNPLFVQKIDGEYVILHEDDIIREVCAYHAEMVYAL